jgi:uncharacterized protein (DUF58 family)
MSHFTDPKILMAIKDLALASKTTVDGFMLGLHHSNVKGQGMEFSQFRSYQPGDDLRLLDWKMFARSDRYYIRESEIDTSISVRFVLDASASMNHSDGAFTKLEYACYLLASLGYLAHKQGDAIGLYILQNGELFSLPSRRDHQHLARFYYQLEQVKAQGKFTEAINYKQVFSAVQKRELLVFVSDFYQQEGEIFELLDKLSLLRHEMLALHLVADNELQLNYRGYTTFQDLETGRIVKINAAETRKEYQQNLQKYLAAVRTRLLDKNIWYRLMTTNEPVDKALSDFLKQRSKQT